MENPRPEKVAVVAEARQRFTESEAVLFTEYRGIAVDEIAQLRRTLRTAGGDYKIYKNTLVRFAVRDLGLDLEDLLTGPTAIAFIPAGGTADPVAVAKALRDFAKGNPNLVLKGGVLGGRLLSLDEIKALAEVAPREELLARLAGGFAAPMQQFAGLLQALPRNFAYGLSALIAKGGAPSAPDALAETSDAGPSGESTEAVSQTEDTAGDNTAETDTEQAGTEESSTEKIGTEEG